MPDELDAILRLVADGRLSPAEAAPIIDALTRLEETRGERGRERAREKLRSEGTSGRRLRIRVTESGRQVVNLRIPIGFVDRALGFVPGIGADQADRIRDAVRSGSTGPILDIDDDGDGVQISVE
ncbi:MAG: hypothetical protein IT341_02445 [Chloroflexi bacterium]|nr:hypothetical protein [Chloroflexota bacterium]